MRGQPKPVSKPSLQEIISIIYNLQAEADRNYKSVREKMWKMNRAAQDELAGYSEACGLFEGKAKAYKKVLELLEGNHND